MKKAFTLIEQLLVIVIVGIITSIVLTISRPGTIKEDSLKKAGKSTFIQVEFVAKSILAKHTSNYSFTTLVDSTGEFSIESSASIARLVEIFKKQFVALRKTLDTSYSTKTLTDGTTTYATLTPSSFSGFIIKNGAYVGIKLNDNCTTEINYIYDPSTPEKNIKKNTCGLIFFDVNEKNEPNLLGVDQYIVALGKYGVK